MNPMTDDERYARLQALARGEVEGITEEDRKHLDWLIGLQSQYKALLRLTERALDEGIERFSLGHEPHWCGGCEYCNGLPAPEPAVVEMMKVYWKIRDVLGMPRKVTPPEPSLDDDLPC